LFLCGEVASEEEPDEAFRQGLTARYSRGEFCLELRNCEATETDALRESEEVRGEGLILRTHEEVFSKR
jgi:hypothetical protein